MNHLPVLLRVTLGDMRHWKSLVSIHQMVPIDCRRREIECLSNLRQRSQYWTVTQWTVALTRNQLGRTGQMTMSFSSHAFFTLSV